MDNCLQMRCKCVVSGEKVELFFYKVPVKCGFKIDKNNTDKVEIDENIKIDDEEKTKRLSNVLRARKNIRRIIWSNQGKYTKFVTLTYANTVLDIDNVRYDVFKFVKNMKNKGYDMKYLYVLENQRERGEKEGNEGSLHVHMVLFIDKYIPFEDINKSWRKGSTHISAIEDIEDLGAYVCKYITKDNLSDFGKRCYSCSLGLDRPSEERFYTLGFSDTDYNFQPEEVLQALNITFYQKMTHDFLDPVTGEGRNQEVMYYQGYWKDKNIIKERDPLNDFARQIDSLHLP